MASTFRIPNIFNFRLRQAKTPFEAAITPRPAPVNNPWSIAGPTFEENSWQPEQKQEQMPDFSMAMPDYSKLYEDTGPEYRRYQQHLRQAPDMQDYAPSKWRRFGAIMSGIGAGLSGGSGYDTARNIVLDPYKTAYENWMGRGQGAKEAATLEEAAANRKATIYQKILSDYMDQQRWKADFEIRWANARTGAERNKILADWNKIREGYQNKQLELTGARDRATAGYQNSMATAAKLNADTNRRQQNWAESPGNLSRYAPFLSGLGSFMRGNEGPAPAYSGGTGAMRIEQLAAKEVAILNPEYMEYFDPEIGDFNWDEMEPKVAIAVRKAVTDTIPIIQRRNVVSRR